MNRRAAALLLLVALLCLPLGAQDKTILKNADIVRMTKSGLGEDVIVALIRKTPSAFDTTPNALANLKKSNVKDAVIMAMLSAVPVVPEPPKPKVDAGRIIKEGVGWGDFIVGSNIGTLVQSLGLPDGPPQTTIPAWGKLGINCLLNTRGDAMEMRFNKDFRGVTQAGIGWGMSEKTVKQAYGEPESVTKREAGEKWEWSSKGILIWFNRGRVTQIVVFKPV